MKTIKTIFAVLFLTSMFYACEPDTVNEDIEMELNKEFEQSMSEDGDEQTTPI